MLDTVHHQGLRLALGAFRTSHFESLYVEAEEQSLFLRREKLTLQYAIRDLQQTPLHKVTFPPYVSDELLQLYESKPNAIRSFRLRVAPLFTSAKDKIKEHSVSELQPWCIRKPTVNLTLHTGKNQN